LLGFREKLNGIGQEVKILLEPQQQMIGDRVFEVAFLTDPDGLAIEILRLIGD
jgi:hypothetical protein